MMMAVAGRGHRNGSLHRDSLLPSLGDATLGERDILNLLDSQLGGFLTLQENDDNEGQQKL